MSRRSINTHPVSGFQGQGAKHSLCHIPHYSMPGLNTCLMSDIRNSDEAIQYYSAPDHFNLPLPYIKFYETESNLDSVLDIVKLKTRWKFNNENLLKICQNKFSPSTFINLKHNLRKKNTKHLPIPLALTRFTQNLMENPDQFFDSEYNWYFKNTIEKIQVDGKWYIVCARGSNLNTLDIIPIDNDTNDTIEVKEKNNFSDPIFDVKSSNSNELMVRQKNKLCVFSSNSDTENILTNESIHDNNDLPLADADITVQHFCSVDVKHVIKLWRERNCIQEKQLEFMSNQTDSFVRLNYLQNQTDIIALINRQKIYLLDSRLDVSKPCSIYDPNSIIEQCEELTTLKSSHLNTHSFYVASNHSVLTLDKRMGFVHKSYHMLSNSPSLINTHSYENSWEPNEMLFLGTQNGESLVNLSYTSLQNDFLSCQTMVSSIPKPLDTLHNIRLEGHCLDPTLINRFSRCLIGTTAIGENMNNLKLYSINSVGDLFIQAMNNTSPTDVTKFKDMVTVKSKTLPKLYYSEVFDMSKLWNLKPLNKNESLKKNNVWSISKEKMLTYVDHLAPLILSPWEIDDLSEWENEDENCDPDNDDSDCDYVTKVHYWFNKNDMLESTEPSQPSTSSPLINFTPEKTKKTVACPASENDEESSSGFTVSMKSEDDSEDKY